MNQSFLIIVIFVIGIVALMFYSVNSNKRERNKMEDNPNDCTTENNTTTEFVAVGNDVTHQNIIASSARIQILETKVSQLESLQWILDILFVLEGICGIWLSNEMLPDEISGIFIMAIILATVIAIYAVNVWASTKQELCKGQAEILKRLEKLKSKF